MRSLEFPKWESHGQDSFRGGCKVSVSAMFVMLVAFGTGLALTASVSPPNITLNIPASFGTSVAVKTYRKGDDILNSPPFHLITSAPMAEYYGWYRAHTADALHGHPWRVRVYAALRKRVVAAYETARDGFEADLNEARQFFGWNQVVTFDTFARFTRKHFRWGDAVSFLHSEYQDGPDGSAKCVPDNDHLTYEVWGVTREQQYTVVASVNVRHPKLATWPNARVAKSIGALKRDRDYKLIETCSAEKFEPSLAAFDQLVDSLKLQ
jgi:hypothetical protein